MLVSPVWVASLTIASTHDSSSRSILYVVTDDYDFFYLRSFLNFSRASGVTVNYSVVGLRELGKVRLNPSEDVVVLLDPNWKPEEEREILMISRKLVTFMLGSGIVVTTYNGVMMLKPALSQYDLPVRIIDNLVGGPINMPRGYNVSKYRVVGILGDQVHEHGSFYRVRVGEGLLVVIPFNIVWAYYDTRDNVYLELLLEALESMNVETPSSTWYRRGLGALIILGAMGLLEASQANSRYLERIQRKIRYVIILYWRINPEKALRHSTRKYLVSILSEKGFAHLNELVRLTGLGKAVLSWHIYVLESRGIISSFKWKKYKYYYLRGEQGLRRLIEGLARRDDDFCRVVRELNEGVEVEAVAKRYKISLVGLEDLTSLLRDRGWRDVLLEICARK
ncbi:ArsR/SmtB family transcription factor [Hyperthermus butylicus]|uniref:ArsR/SmtB family transcription factor n=1 Tax=Hyperthermus butylicus TaxID=54248 RepID=UPI000A5157F7|nr:helix-turn-helix transcriptional regulator [Hyperthermus butylicus]